VEDARKSLLIISKLDKKEIRKRFVNEIRGFLGKVALKTFRFSGTAFMQSTSRSHFTFKRQLLLMSGVAICPFPVVDRTLDW
jgi:hypothetical protein